MKTKNELPNPADFMMLGEKAFEENVAEELRNKLSATEKQIWINGYLLALTEQNKRKKSYSEIEVELIAYEMVNWAIDNIGNISAQSGKKFDEVIAKFKNK